jgi:two-component system cell cycle response regulator
MVSDSFMLACLQEATARSVWKVRAGDRNSRVMVSSLRVVRPEVRKHRILGAPKQRSLESPGNGPAALFVPNARDESCQVGRRGRFRSGAEWSYPLPMTPHSPRIVLVAASEPGLQVLADRLKMQGYAVEVAASTSEAAQVALANPPAAVVADLWMPGISGVQLCRLLGREPATNTVPVILRGSDGRRNRFWAEQGGAVAYVTAGRMGDLVRALTRAIAATPPSASFFTDLRGEQADIRDRIATYLDEALFESVIASEVRALGTSGSFERIFDLFSQFISRVTSYRWLAVATEAPVRFGLHSNPKTRASNEKAAREALGVHDAVVVPVEDEDAYDDEGGPPPIVLPIKFGSAVVGTIALATRDPGHPRDRDLVAAVARELGGPIRMARLVEESQRLATIDPLTGLNNRRAFIEGLGQELDRRARHGYPVSVMLLDVDHFKAINDRFGHATGDLVLASVGKALQTHFRKVDVVARWGGEEFVVALSGAAAEGAHIAAERLRQTIEELEVARPSGEPPVKLTISLGLATHRLGEPLDSVVDRADRAMYGAKTMGRNRVVVDTTGTDVAGAPPDGTELETGRWKNASLLPS